MDFTLVPALAETIPAVRLPERLECVPPPDRESMSVRRRLAPRHVLCHAIEAGQELFAVHRHLELARQHLK